MRIETFYHGKSLGTEDGAHGLTHYLAFITAHDHPEIVMNMQIEGAAAAMIEMLDVYFDHWFQAMYDHHEFHVEDYDGKRLFDQYLVTEEWNL